MAKMKKIVVYTEKVQMSDTEPRVQILVTLKDGVEYLLDVKETPIPRDEIAFELDNCFSNKKHELLFYDLEPHDEGFLIICNCRGCTCPMEIILKRAKKNLGRSSEITLE